MKRILLALIALTAFCSAQVLGQRAPDPNTGDARYRRQGTMDGNLVRTIFINWGEIAHWPDQPSGEWPKGSGHSYVDGVALVVQARTIDNNGQVIYPMETQYREFVDKGPKDELWGWAPLPGYFNPRGDKPAMSNDPTTWPVHWPDKPSDWDGFWNGFFGKGVTNADLESYFVFDDDPDEEWDFYPDPDDTTRRGLGLEVATRLFQWSQVLAEDVLFAIYFITNEGKTSYDSTYYCFYIDWGVGGTDDSSDDTGNYNLKLDIAWAWDWDGFGTPGRWSPVGVAGFAFLESPGIKYDGRDNDDDGLIDERRDDPGPGVWLDTYPYGAADPDAFREAFNREPRPHWSADEDMDWMPFEDLNGNGRWDMGEPLHDDVGEDGLGPFMDGYPGPDRGEADGIPTPGEPNYSFLDKDESDQIGLTGFRIFPVHTYELWNEEQNWKVFVSAPQPKDALQVTANLGMFFSSGPFPLRPGQTENYSMALIFAEDADDLARTKKTVQQIYNADYRFAKPPEKPTLTAIPGDGKVILLWDTRAENSWDPFLQAYDFEGYRIYRSTEPEFLETKVITDAYGRPTFRKPIAQFDLQNGIKGLHPIDVEGVKFNLGSDTSLRHVFIDTDVQNGQTYYYAVVSYDRGLVDTSATGEIEGIAPAECASVIKTDIAGNVQTDVNTAVVVPNPPSAGYVAAGLQDRGLVHEGPGTGSMRVQFVIEDSVVDNARYLVLFDDTSRFHNTGVPFYSLYRIVSTDTTLLFDRLAVWEETESPLFDGIVVNLLNDPRVEVDYTRTGWLVGSCNYKTYVDFDPLFVSANPAMHHATAYPADYEIRFSDKVEAKSARKLGFPETPVKFSIWNVTEGVPAQFFFRDVVKDSTLTPDSGEGITIFIDDPLSAWKVTATWRLTFEVDSLKPVTIPPAPGDIFRIATTKPFRKGERFEFQVSAPKYDRTVARSMLDQVIVVPNPYVVGNSWEPRSPYRFGRGGRRIQFLNLPPKCTIRIYTVRGQLVDTIYHDAPVSYGAETWDLVSKDGQDIAYGIYLYHIDAPGIGSATGRFAVIK